MKLPDFTIQRTGRALSSACMALMLSGCGGGDNNNNANIAAPTSATPAATVAAAPLAVSNASPASLNGTLDKAAAQFEHGSSNALMTTYATSDDHCRVGAFALRSSNGTAYYIEVSFRKDNQAVGRVNFGLDAGLTLQARAVAPVAGVTVDVASRRIGFTNVVVGNPPGTATSITLNGTLEYPTNFAPENRAACG